VKKLKGKDLEGTEEGDLMRGVDLLQNPLPQKRNPLRGFLLRFPISLMQQLMNS
jgi:hypothetical protein